MSTQVKVKACLPQDWIFLCYTYVVPVHMPELPLFIHMFGKVAVTTHQFEGQLLFHVLSMEGENARILLDVKVVSKRHWNSLSSTDMNKSLSQWIRESSQDTRLDPLGLIGIFQTKPLRGLLTGHLIALHRELDSMRKSHVEDVVAHTAQKYKELTSWGESSSAWILSKEMDVPVATIHNRLRLARQRNLLDSPGTGVRR